MREIYNVTFLRQLGPKLHSFDVSVSVSLSFMSVIEHVSCDCTAGERLQFGDCDHDNQRAVAAVAVARAVCSVRVAVTGTSR